MTAPRNLRRFKHLTELTAGVALVGVGIVAAACADKPPLTPLGDPMSSDDAGSVTADAIATADAEPVGATSLTDVVDASARVERVDSGPFGAGIGLPLPPIHTNYSPTHMPPRATAAPISTAPPPPRTNR
jgi:hypothetical protein